MRTRDMIIISVVMYALFLTALIAVIVVFKDNQNAFMLGLYSVSSGLSFFTIVLAVLFLRKTPSEAYMEKYGDEPKKE